METQILNIEQEFFDFISSTSGEVVMVVPGTDGRILLMTKAFYPPGVYRLPTGKLREGEAPEDGLRRELFEETGFVLPIDRELGALNYVLRCGDSETTLTSYVFLLEKTDEEPQSSDPGESITGFACATPGELRNIAEQLRNLEPKWSDWGRFRSIAHYYVADALGYS